MTSTVRVLFIGDIFGRAGRVAVRTVLPLWRHTYTPHLVIANGENMASGAGITPRTVAEVLDCGIDALTTGNHVWDRPEASTYLSTTDRVLRPINFPPTAPGRGTALLTCTVDHQPVRVLLINAMGRVFMPPLDCPFRALDAALRLHGSRTEEPSLVDTSRPQVILLDFHAEATGEKQAMGYFLDGRVSAVVGTHTHVATADAAILPLGTGYMTDVGMTGPLHSVIGAEIDAVIQRFVTGMPHRTRPAEGEAQINAVLIDVDVATGATTTIQRIAETVPGLPTHERD